MPLGAVEAVWFQRVIAYSHLSDMGGPIDIIVLMCVAASGAIGMALLDYTVEVLIGSDRTKGENN